MKLVRLLMMPVTDERGLTRATATEEIDGNSSIHTPELDGRSARWSGRSDEAGPTTVVPWLRWRWHSCMPGMRDCVAAL